MAPGRRVGPYRIEFYAGDRGERQHVHVKRDNAEAKFWIDEVTYVTSNRFSAVELRRIYRIVDSLAEELRREWDDFFSR